MVIKPNELVGATIEIVDLDKYGTIECVHVLLKDGRRADINSVGEYAGDESFGMDVI